MNKQRFKIILMFAIVFLPFIVAYIMIKTEILIPQSKTNNGQLISPPLQLTDLPIRNIDNEAMTPGDWLQKWRFFIVNNQNCDDSCQNSVHTLRQIHLLLNKESDRVERYYLTTKNLIPSTQSILNSKENYPYLKFLSVEEKQINSLIDAIYGNNKSIYPTILLIDPLGNIMMYYTPDQLDKKVVDDIKKLLKSSKIG